MFGGKAAKEGIETTTAVKGDRKATITDTTERIVDLSEEKVYEIDRNKKTYTVMTFEEMRRRMEEAREKAKKDMAKQQPTEKRSRSRRRSRPRRWTSISTSRRPDRRSRSSATTRTSP